jgi:hypothetical protein
MANKILSTRQVSIKKYRDAYELISMIHIHVLNNLKLVLKDYVFYEAELFLPHCAMPQCVKDSTAVLRAKA